MLPQSSESTLTAGAVARRSKTMAHTMLIMRSIYRFAKGARAIACAALPMSSSAGYVALSHSAVQEEGGVDAVPTRHGGVALTALQFTDAPPTDASARAVASAGLARVRTGGFVWLYPFLAAGVPPSALGLPPDALAREHATSVRLFLYAGADVHDTSPPLLLDIPRALNAPRDGFYCMAAAVARAAATEHDADVAPRSAHDLLPLLYCSVREASDSEYAARALDALDAQLVDCVSLELFPGVVVIKPPRSAAAPASASEDAFWLMVMDPQHGASLNVFLEACSKPKVALSARGMRGLLAVGLLLEANLRAAELMRTKRPVPRGKARDVWPMCAPVTSLAALVGATGVARTTDGSLLATAGPTLPQLAQLLQMRDTPALRERVAPLFDGEGLALVPLAAHDPATTKLASLADTVAELAPHFALAAAGGAASAAASSDALAACTEAFINACGSTATAVAGVLPLEAVSPWATCIATPHAVASWLVRHCVHGSGYWHDAYDSFTPWVGGGRAELCAYDDLVRAELAPCACSRYCDACEPRDGGVTAVSNHHGKRCGAAACVHAPQQERDDHDASTQIVSPPPVYGENEQDDDEGDGEDDDDEDDDAADDRDNEDAQRMSDALCPCGDLWPRDVAWWYSAGGIARRIWWRRAGDDKERVATAYCCPHSETRATSPSKRARSE